MQPSGNKVVIPIRYTSNNLENSNLHISSRRDRICPTTSFGARQVCRDVDSRRRMMKILCALSHQNVPTPIHDAQWWSLMRTFWDDHQATQYRHTQTRFAQSLHFGQTWHFDSRRRSVKATRTLFWLPKMCTISWQFRPSSPKWEAKLISAWAFGIHHGQSVIPCGGHSPASRARVNNHPCQSKPGNAQTSSGSIYTAAALCTKTPNKAEELIACSKGKHMVAMSRDADASKRNPSCVAEFSICWPVSLCVRLRRIAQVMKR